VSGSSSTWYLSDRDAVRFVRKLLEEKDVDAVLQRLDRLTQDEVRITAVQTLEVVYGLVENMSVVMDGEQNQPLINHPCIEYAYLQTGRHR
jgi:hypothetical protein